MLWTLGFVLGAFSAILKSPLSFCLWIFLKIKPHFCRVAIHFAICRSQFGITAVCSHVGSLEVGLVAD